MLITSTTAERRKDACGLRRNRSPFIGLATLELPRGVSFSFEDRCISFIHLGHCLHSTASNKQSVPVRVPSMCQFPGSLITIHESQWNCFQRFRMSYLSLQIRMLPRSQDPVKISSSWSFLQLH